MLGILFLSTDKKQKKEMVIFLEFKKMKVIVVDDFLKSDLK